jgi:hypothetical protein
MKIWRKLLSPPVYIRKMNLVRKWIKSYFLKNDTLNP